MNNEQKKQAWQALQHFYKMKSVLLPEFMERNKRNLGDIESKLINQYEDKYQDVKIDCGCKKNEFACREHSKI